MSSFIHFIHFPLYTILELDFDLHWFFFFNSLIIFLECSEIIQLKTFLIFSSWDVIFHLTDGCRENFSIELESVNHLVKNYNLMTIFGNLEVCLLTWFFSLIWNIFLFDKYNKTSLSVKSPKRFHWSLVAPMNKTFWFKLIKLKLQNIFHWSKISTKNI